ncbi:VWA domain-containing protein [Mycolicibacterium farcinogenes]|nr:VWA domain-containing protein [Mycolicibacterium farcinogenes]
MVGRHPKILPQHRGSGDAAGCHRTAQPAHAAARTGDDGQHRPGSVVGHHADHARRGHSRRIEGLGAGPGTQGGRGHRAPHRRRHSGHAARRAVAQRTDQPAAGLRHRLEPHHRPQPENVPAGPEDDHPRAAGRVPPRRASVTKDIVLAIDQSGSMAESIVYSAVFGAVIASMRSLRTSLVVFDTEVVDLTDLLDDPVDVLFGTQLGGGTDINRAIAYCQTLITRPTDSIFVLISDLYEGGVRDEMLARVKQLVDAGVTVVVLLALSDSGAPSFDREIAADLAAMEVPAFACTPDAFPELLALAITKGDIRGWADRTGLAQRGMDEA